MKCDYIIVGVTEDGVEHYIGCSFEDDNWFTMEIKTMRRKFNNFISGYYKKVYLKKVNKDEDFW